MMPSSRLALSRIILEKRDGDIAYHIDLPEPFDLRLVEDEAGCFNPVDPVGLLPVWLLLAGVHPRCTCVTIL